MSKLKLQILKLFLSFAILIFITTGFNFAEINPSKVAILINGKEVVFTNETPFIDVNGRTQVPFKVALEAFGSKVSWQQSMRVAIAEKDGIRVEVPIGQKYLVVNGQRVDNDTAAMIVDSKTYLPIKKVLEAFGAEVSWNPKSNAVEVVSAKDKNIFTEAYLQKLVDTTESHSKVQAFREISNVRRNGLLKIEGKYFDMYYPDDKYGKEVASFLAPHMDKVYTMLTDIYGLQATVEVHLIHERDAQSLREGDIRAKERITYVWLESGNDGDGNNLSEFVHEVNHNFFDEANGGSTNVMWLNEANAKLISSLYLKHNYDGRADMWSHYEINALASELNNAFKSEGITLTLDRANESLKLERAWSMADGEKWLAQKYGIYLWSYIYDKYELKEHNNILRNLGTGDVINKLEVLLGQRSQELSDDVLENIRSRLSSN